ncbi:unnamed protein product [Notodromas monacha]|uniref:Cytochrome P450 n=1 Tax=Notodromas monacha TaxID=399045 RepID=A0A7R9GH23_9CRUS|nr:unnamed protein product [Notodromas monacha]CAG0922310.1 unnamed protein product [Notodromas monacha]
MDLFAGLIHSNGNVWKQHRRFCLRHLKDFGFGKSSLDSLILQEFESMMDSVFVSAEKRGRSIIAVLDENLNAAVTNVIWWLLACKVTAQDQEFVDILRVIQVRIDFTILNLLSLFPGLNIFDPPSRFLRFPSLEQKRDYFYAYMQVREILYLIEFHLVFGLSIDSFTQKILQEHRETLDAESPRDLIDCFLVEQKKWQSFQDKEKNYISDEMIEATLVDLFTAGAETTSTTLRWIVLILIQNPAIMRKVCDEVDAVVGTARLPCSSDADHVQTLEKWLKQAKLKCPALSMHYTVATIWEVWRYITVVPFGLNRQVSQDMDIGGYRVPKGTIIITSILSMHQDSKSFENPHEFRPERFLDAEGNLMKNIPRIMPFQSGKRQCLGESLARRTTFLGLTYLLQNNTFEMVPGEVYDLEPKQESQILNLPKQFKVMITARHS